MPSPEADSVHLDEAEEQASPSGDQLNQLVDSDAASLSESSLFKAEAALDKAIFSELDIPLLGLAESAADASVQDTDTGSPADAESSQLTPAQVSCPHCSM